MFGDIVQLKFLNFTLGKISASQHRNAVIERWCNVESFDI